MKTAGREKGFTLIELLIVIAVIAILAALAIPNLISSRKSANETNAISMMRSIVGAEEQYRSRALGSVPYGLLSDLSGKSLISWPSGATTGSTFIKSGYTFADASGSPATTTWGAYAYPTTAQDGDRDFGASNDGFVRFQADPNPGAALTAPTASGIQGWTALQ